VHEVDPVELNVQIVNLNAWLSTKALVAQRQRPLRLRASQDSRLEDGVLGSKLLTDCASPRDGPMAMKGALAP